MTIEESIEHKKVVVHYLEAQLKAEKTSLEYLEQKKKDLEDEGE